MSQDPENLKKIAKEHSDKLAKLGMDLGEIQFSYRIEEKVTKKYWHQRIDDFKKYNEKGLEYYNQVTCFDGFSKQGRITKISITC